MTSSLSRIWDRIHSGYWFLPSSMALGAALLAYGTVTLDRAAYEGAAMAWLVTESPSGGRAVLSTTASSLVTVAGVAFSITVVALALAASQLGSKVLRTFMRDSGNKTALGTFVAAFIYCVLVLRTIRGGEEGGGTAFVPTISIAVAILLTVLSIGMLVYFLHHVATSIQAEHVVAEVADDLRNAVERLYPERIGGERTQPLEASEPEWPKGTPANVASEESGYIQAVNGERLLKLAVDENLFIRLLCRPGQFVCENVPLAQLHPAERASPALVRKIRHAFELGRQRTTFQDVEFGVDQLAQIALRALSPGVNDTLTAIACMDWLEAELRRYAGRREPSPFRTGSDGRVRLIVRLLGPEELAHAAFAPLRRAARGNAAATHRLLALLVGVAEVCEHPRLKGYLRFHADQVARGARDSLASDADRQEAESRYQAALKALDERGAADT